MPRGISELKFEGNMLVGWPRRRWFCQLLEYEEERRCQENLRGKIEDFSSMIPHKIAQW
jgi:hypothetical protein